MLASWLVVGVAGFGGGVVLLPAPAYADGSTCSLPEQILENSASGDPLTIPDGVSRVILSVEGQAGQDWYYNGLHFSGGRGTGMKAIMDVTPGERLDEGALEPGPGGLSKLGPSTGENLDSVGPDGGYGGSAGFWAQLTSVGCYEPLLVAAGGGGAGADADIGSAPPGAGVGGDSDTGTGAGRGGDGGDNSAVDGAGGGGATATGGGAGGAYGYSALACPNGHSGETGGLFSAGAGGDGHDYVQRSVGTSCHAGEGAGGGGAGYYYGGGGGSGFGTYASGGGGGGSPYIAPGLTLVSETQGLPGVWAQGLSTVNKGEAVPVGGGAKPADPVIEFAYDTTIRLSSSPNPSIQTEPATFTALVSTADPSFPIGGGIVTFVSAGQVIGTAPVVPGAPGTGTATFTTSALPPGTDLVAARFGGFDGGTFDDRASQSAGSVQQQVLADIIPAVTTSPQAQKVNGGDQASFYASATGLPSPMVQWQVSSDSGGHWTDIVGATDSSLLIVTREPVQVGQFLGYNGQEFRAIFSNVAGSTPSAAASLTVLGAPSVLVAPTDVLSPVGASVEFVASGAGNFYPSGSTTPSGPLSEWQVSRDDGVTWSDVAPTRTQQVAGQVAETITELDVSEVAATDDGTEVRAVFSNEIGSAVTSTATLSVLDPCIKDAPTSTNHSECAGVDLSGLNLGAIDLSYGDYERADLSGDTIRGATGADFAGANLENLEGTHAVMSTARLQGADLTRADLSAADLDVADLTSATLAGADLSGASLQGANLTGTSVVPPSVTVYTLDSAASAAWATPASLPGATFQGCDHSSGDDFPLGQTTVTCTVADDALLANPGAGRFPATGTFTVTVDVATAPSFPVVTFPVQPSDAFVQYSPDPAASASFFSLAVGGPNPTVHWQVRPAGGETWTDVPGADGFTLVVPHPQVSDDGNQYRAVFENIAGTLTSDAATLHVSPAPIDTAITGSQTYGGDPSYVVTDTPPAGVSVTGQLTCDAAPGTPVTPILAPGTYTLVDCSGLNPSDPNYTVEYDPEPDGFVVSAMAITQHDPTTGETTTTASASFADQLSATFPGESPVTFTQDTGSRELMVSSTGVVATTGPLSAGTHTASGTTTATGGTGTWSYTLTVVPEPITQDAPTTGSASLGDPPFTGQLASGSGAIGFVTYIQTAGLPALTVSPAGAVTAARGLAAGKYPAGGMMSDAFGDSGTWTFTLVVSDSDLSITTIPDVPVIGTALSVPVSFAPPTATDGATPVPATCDHVSGSLFPIGTTKVTCQATDEDDTPSTVSSSFNVVVSDSDLSITTVSPIVMDATGPSGAKVSFDKPTATDGATPVPVTCDHVSGSLFPIGTTKVTCQATDEDDTPSTMSSSFTVTVNGALTQLQALLTWEQSLDQSPGSSIVDKTQAAIIDLEAGNVTDACISLTGLIHLARAQSGKALTPSQAALIIDTAGRVRAVLDCGKAT